MNGLMKFRTGLITGIETCMAWLDAVSSIGRITTVFAL